jgi:hypothetical protein
LRCRLGRAATIPSEIEIITDGGRRRRWSPAEKLRIVEETLDGRESISVVARRNGVAPNLSFGNGRASSVTPR